ncbi:Stk1 family PASTA domain-containing Ser/Thr kinase [Lachnospiraceae bacterium ZAX-1]
MLTEGMYIADRYEVVGKIGAGGMSDVYKAKDHTLGRFIAIKVLKQEFSEDVNFVTKFRTEAQSAAGLEHPNIVNIYDVGSENGMYYIVMEYVEGITLKTYIEKKGQLSFKEAVSISIQVGRGIESAHNKRIIHRDIKPQNIIISTEGKVKVTDFGIARAASSNTISSDVMGSVHYSSPEQARNGFVDGKSDIYSLGIVMYEMVTGHVPFDADTTVAIAIQHLQEEMVVPSAYAAELPISMEKIILKCTQKSADRRYESIVDLLIDLKKALISPDEDFVVMIPVAGQDKTRIIESDDVNAIKEETRGIYVKAQKKEIEEEEEDDEENEKEDTGFLNPKMEKAVTIMGIVAALIIIGIIIYIIGSVSGLFKFGEGNRKEPEKTAQEEEADKQAELEAEDETSKTEQVKMISVVGSTVATAKEKLNGIQLGIFEKAMESSDEYESGVIMRQEIDEGEMVDINTTLNVIVSSGAGSFEAPDVTGYESDAAIAKLKDVDLKFNREFENSTSVAPGRVISQDPVGGTSVKKGDTVTIVVSQGKAMISVPNVIDQPEEVAKEILAEAGLVVTNVTGETSDSIAAGNVISQSIAEGSFAEAGTNITLIVSLGRKPSIYSFSREIDKPDETYIGAKIELRRKDTEEVINTWSTSSFPYTVNETNIVDCSEGILIITWETEDDDPGPPDKIPVNFTKVN